MINIAIVDDEAQIVNKLNEFIDKFVDESDKLDSNEVSVSSFSDGFAFLASQFWNYDIVFMDICMPMKDGLEIAREFRKKNETACLIFVTNLADMAIRGYEVDALDFVVKPVEYGDFKYRMEKAVKRATAKSDDYIMVSNARSLIKVSVGNIMYVETIYHRVVYHTVTGEIEEWSSMREAEKKLLKYGFTRCNSGYLVNLRFVEAVRGNLVYIGGNSLVISRNRKAGLLKDMIKYLSVAGVGV